MSTGYEILWAIIRDHKRTLFSDLDSKSFKSSRFTSSVPSELEFYNFLYDYLFTYRQLPDPKTVNQNGFPYEDLSEPLEYYLQRLHHRNVREKSVEFHKTLTTHLKEGKFSDISSKVEEYLHSIKEERSSTKVKTLSQIATEFKRDLQLAKEGKIKSAIPFGWPTLDKVTGGGMLGGDVVYMVARPGQGKSSLIGAVSYHAHLRGLKTLTFSMEMVDKSFASRIIAQGAGFNPNALRTLSADFHTEQKLQAFIDEESKRNENGGYYVAEGSFRQTPDTIKSLVESVQPDVVYIDAAYLVSSRLSAKAKWERLSEVGEDLKKIALDYDIPIFQTVQFNRNAGSKNSYELENIAGGDFIGQLGSVVLSVQSGEGVHEDTRRRVRVIKNRDGDQADFEINFSFNPPNFSEVNLEDEEDPDRLYDEDFPL